MRTTHVRVSRQTVRQHAHVRSAARIRVIAQHQVARLTRQLRTKRNQRRNGGAGNFRAENNGNIALRLKPSLQLHKLFHKLRRELSFLMRQPPEHNRFLAGRHFHKLRGPALQLDLVRINDEQLGAKMADAAANLPSDERVLGCWIISYQQDGLRLIQLLHGEQGIAGALAQRSN